MRLLPIVIACLFLGLSAASADDSMRPAGQNCDLAKPPEGAGEVADHHALLYVFPRAREIGSDYSGCQDVWVQQNGTLTLAWSAVIKRGDVARIWSPDAAVAESLAKCQWENGALKKGSLDACGDSKSLVMKSYHSGCFSKAAEGKFSAEESDARWVRDCGDPQ